MKATRRTGTLRRSLPSFKLGGVWTNTSTTSCGKTHLLLSPGRSSDVRRGQLVEGRGGHPRPGGSVRHGLLDPCEQPVGRAAGDRQRAARRSVVPARARKQGLPLSAGCSEDTGRRSHVWKLLPLLNQHSALNGPSKLASS